MPTEAKTPRAPLAAFQARSLKPGRAAKLLLAWLSILFIYIGCSYPQRFDNGLAGPEAPDKHDRELVLTFERESDFSPLAGRQVTVILTSPGELLIPAKGRGVTDGAGRLRLVISPVAVYDKSALKTGDIVVDYPAELTVAMVEEGATFEWDLDASQSFARYQDPLYQGLNRDPASAPLNMTLTIP